MPQNKVVLFDIDYTLFNTDLFREKVYPALAKKINYESSEAFYQLAKDIEAVLKQKQGHFSPKAFIEELSMSVTLNVSTTELDKIISDDAVYAEGLYDAVGDMLETLGKANVTIGILSTGNTEFQRLKIKQIAHRFSEEHIHIFANKLTELKNVLAKYAGSKVYIVDDLPTVLAAAKKINNEVTTILAKREKKYEQTDLVNDFIPDYFVENMAMVENIILNT